MWFEVLKKKVQQTHSIQITCVKNVGAWKTFKFDKGYSH